jgi:glycosyltransferase involved in cell wall biosynthesis
MISFHPLSENKKYAFSILLPTWNNLELLKICVSSIRKNSAFDHQIIVHVNEGTDGTVEWLKTERIDYTFSSENIGICKGVNASRTLAKSELLLYLNDDMYVCPGWDSALMDEVKKIGHSYFFLSGTMLEPRFTGNNCCIAPCEFGDSVSTFNENGLLEKFASYPFQDFAGTTWPPSLVHAQLWDMCGGLSVEFSPGMYSDPDLCMKLWYCGVRYFKGLSASRVYHFMSKSTSRVKRNNGKKQFLKKWGVSASYFMRDVLHRGEPFTGPLKGVEIETPLKDRLKRIFSF